MSLFITMHNEHNPDVFASSVVHIMEKLRRNELFTRHTKFRHQCKYFKVFYVVNIL